MMCKKDSKEENMDENILDITARPQVRNTKGKLVPVADYLKDIFTFYMDEFPSISYYAIGNNIKKYYKLGQSISEYCQETTYMEFQATEKNKRKRIEINEIYEVFLVALYNLYESTKRTDEH